VIARRVLFAALASLAGCAAGSRAIMSDEYQHSMLAASTALIACDWGMTRWMPQTGAYERGYVELNPLLGRTPSTARVDATFAIALAAHVAAYPLLPGWARSWWYTTVTALDLANIVMFDPVRPCGNFGELGR
jgi:hypothetical protein